MTRTAAAFALLLALLVAAPAAHGHTFDQAAGLDARAALFPAQAGALLAQKLGVVRSSPNVEHLGWIAEQGATSTGGQLVGDYFYVTSWKDIAIYDVSDPVHPELMSRTSIGFKFENEDVSTNGEVLLFSEQAPSETLHVWDVRDKRAPREVGTLPGAGTHTATCLLDCSYEYGSYHLLGPRGPATAGEIVDLRDPSNPRRAGDWAGGIPGFTGKSHDVTEVAPGRVLTASMPILFLDARSDVTRPRLLARGTNVSKQQHTARWPNGGRDRFVLTSYETNAHPQCDETSAEFATWDASKWRSTGTFTPIDEFRASNGTFVDGSPPANVLGCSAHWFEAHPDFRDGGLVAVGFYDHGTKFLRVDRRGQIDEAGWFLPPGAETSAAYWITDEIVYTVDYARGIDILRVTK
ncbi:MAG: LVIVD repeat-containing protein [Solirubrobacteraceae bacterium]